MESFLLLLVLIGLVWLSVTLDRKINHLTSALQQANESIRKLSQTILQMTEQGVAAPPEAQSRVAEPAPVAPPIPAEPAWMEWKPTPPPEETLAPEPDRETQEPAFTRPYRNEPEPTHEPMTLAAFAAKAREARPVPEHESVQAEYEPPFVAAPPPPPVSAPPYRPATPPPKPPFDWEKFIGEHLNKVGIAILTIGIGIFVKYAIDKDWINEVGRVLIGLGAGGILAGFAHYMRRDFRAFSSVLLGGAIAVFYFTIGIAFHTYALFSQPVAFVLMVGITALGVFFSYAYDRMELALIALLGGFATPLMVSTGSGNYAVLFTYLIILNLGMLALSWQKKWQWVYIASYVCTLLLYGSWLGTRYQPADAMGALGFGTAFYAIFFAAIVVFNLRTGLLFYGSDFVLVLSLNLAYFTAGIFILNDVSAGDYRGLFTLLLAAGNLGAAWGLYRRRQMDRNFLYLLVGLVMTYVTLAAPIQMQGNQITLFWAAEAVLLLWLFGKSQIKLLLTGSLVLLPLMGLSLVMDWLKYYADAPLTGPGTMTPMLNQPFVTGLFCVAALAAYRWLARRTGDLTVPHFTNRDDLLPVLNIATFALGYLAGAIEVFYQATIAEGPGQNKLNVLLTLAYTAAWAAALQLFARWRGLGWMLNVLMGVTAMLCLLHVSVGNQLAIILRDEALLYHHKPLWHFLVQYLGVAAMAVAVLQAVRTARNDLSVVSAAIWVAGTYWVILLAQQIDHAMLLALCDGTPESAERLLSISQRVLYPIAWGLTAFAAISAGIRLKYRMMRIFGLALFAIIILKLFLIDLTHMAAGGRIAAFISLGVLLLVISFMYQKLKALVVGDAPAPAEPEPPLTDPDAEPDVQSI